MNLTGRQVYQKGTKRRRKKESDRDFLDWLKTLACCFCRKPPPSDPAHVRLGGRGFMGGKPKFSAVPLCRSCHARSHGKDYLVMLSKEQWLRLSDEYLKRWKEIAEAEHGAPK